MWISAQLLQGWNQKMADQTPQHEWEGGEWKLWITPCQNDRALRLWLLCDLTHWAPCLYTHSLLKITLLPDQTGDLRWLHTTRSLLFILLLQDKQILHFPFWFFLLPRSCSLWLSFSTYRYFHVFYENKQMYLLCNRVMTCTFYHRKPNLMIFVDKLWVHLCILDGDRWWMI